MIARFLSYLRYERNRSELTVRRYERSLRDFEAYFQGRDAAITWASVDADLIRGWMETLVDKGNKASSVSADLSALKTFFRFALSRKLIENDLAQCVNGPKKQKPLPLFMKEHEMDMLLDEETWSEDYKDVRARTIIILLYEAGLRRSELVGLDDSDIDFAARLLKVTGKRNKQRLVPFGEELGTELQHYMEMRDKETGGTSGALFLNRHGERITADQVYAEVRKQLSRVTTMKKRSPHVLRHTFATALLNNGAGLEGVRQLLGHQSLETTEIYTHTTFEQLRRVYKEAHPRGGKKPL